MAALALLGVLGSATAAALALLAIAALVVAFRWPQFLGAFVGLLLPAGESIHVLGAQVAPLEAVVGGGALGYLIGVVSRREAVRLSTADWIFACLVAFIGVSTFGPVDDSDRLRELLFWGALGVVFHAVTTHLRGRRDFGLLLGALAVGTLFEASLAVYEYLDRWSYRFSLLDGAIVYPLPQATLGHPNALSQFLVLAVLGVLALALVERGMFRWLGFLAVAAGLLALVVTFSRAAWIAFAIGVCVYLADRRTRPPVLAAGALALTGAVILVVLDAGAIGARISSVFEEPRGLYDFRLELVGRAARIAADHPFTGSGHFEEAGVYAGRPDLATHPHNLFLGVAVFFGIPAALAFAGLVALAFKAAWNRFRAPDADYRLAGLGSLALLVAFLVNGLLEYPFWNTTLTVLVVLALALAVSLEPRKVRS